MSKPDAERAMEIYKKFTKQTDFVVQYLSTARQYEHATRVEVPKLKHAPVNLGKQLEDYLVDPDFEINRRQYIAEQEGKKGRVTTNGASKGAAAAKTDSETRAAAARAFPDTSTAPKPQATKAPAPDLIDFFDSIEQAPAPQQMPQQAPPQQQASYNPFNNTGAAPFQAQPQQLSQNGFAQPQNGFQSPNQFSPQPFNNGFTGNQQQPQQLQPSFTGAGFGGYSPQQSFQPGALGSIPQESPANFQPGQPQQLGNMQTGGLAAPQTTNPFRMSMMSTQPTGMSSPAFPMSPPVSSPINRQNTNPFAKSTSPASGQPFPPVPDQFQQQHMPQQQTAAPLQAMATGTNPFARNMSMNAASPRPQTAGGLMPQPTGSTNPFRQSQFVNHTTGAGWQNNQQPIGGGLDHLETVPIFPRPQTSQAWQQ